MTIKLGFFARINSQLVAEFSLEPLAICEMGVLSVGLGSPQLSISASEVGKDKPTTILKSELGERDIVTLGYARVATELRVEDRQPIKRDFGLDVSETDQLSRKVTITSSDGIESTATTSIDSHLQFTFYWFGKKRQCFSVLSSQGLHGSEQAVKRVVAPSSEYTVKFSTELNPYSI